MKTEAAYRTIALFTIASAGLLGSAGCIPIAPCFSDADCDDASDCTMDDCFIAPGETGVCSFEFLCLDEDHCVDNRCVNCLDAAECDNSDFCDGVETCSETGACVNGEPPTCDDGDLCTEDQCEPVSGCSNPPKCSTEEICEPATGNCYPDDGCRQDIDCPDDGLFCNGVESCDLESGLCTTSGDPCSPDQWCDEVGASCYYIDPCTTDTDCPDDGVFCNGLESCNDQGLCVSSGDLCGPGLCDELEQACVDPEPCADDADCQDDGLFCNGVESCVEAGFCVSSGDPCSANEPCDGRYCNELYDLCSTCPPDYVCDPFGGLTSGVDDVRGGLCDDTLHALLAFSPVTGTNRPTLQTGDRVDGREGDDTLLAQFNFTTPNVVAPTLISVETVSLVDFGTATTTLAGQGITGTTLFSVFAGQNTNALVVSNLNALADLAITNQGVGAALGFTTAATAGSDDRVTVTLDGMTGGGVTFVTDANNGIETANVVSLSQPNTLSSIAVNGATLTAVSISGDAPLTLSGAVTAHVINATTFAAGLTMTATSVHATHVVGGDGSDTLYGTSIADAIAGGPGDDTLIGLAGADLITTGPGNDVLVMVLVDAGDIIADFAPATDTLDWNSPLSSIDATVTTPGATAAFQSAPAGTALLPTTTVFELTGTTVTSHTAANLAAALGATANTADTDANILFVVYDASGGATVWAWSNADANVDADELTLVATLGGVSIDGFAPGNSR